MQGHGFGPWRGKYYMLHGVGPHPLKKSQPLVTTWMDHESESESRSVVSDSLWPHEPHSSWNSPGQNTGVSSLSSLQGILPIQGSNPGLLHWRRILYQLSHKESPRLLEWVAYPFSSISSWPRNRTRVSCIAGGFFTSWATRETHSNNLFIVRSFNMEHNYP